MVVRAAGGEKGVAPAAQLRPGAGDIAPDGNGQVDLRRQLIRRMGVAAMLIVVLLAALAVFDYVNTQEDAVVSGVQFTEPVPVRKREAAEPPMAPPPPVEQASEQQPPLPAEAAEREAGTAPLPGSSSAVQSSPVTPSAAAREAALPRPRTGGADIPLRSAAEPPATAVQAPPAAVLLSPSAAQPAGSAVPAPRPVSGYVLQSELLLDVRRAESLQAQLAQEGIAATVETRLRIGPFRTRAEVEATRRKLKELGIETAPLARKGR